MRITALILTLLVPLNACAQDQTDKTIKSGQVIEKLTRAKTPTNTALNAEWAQTATAKILERDYREFLDLLPGLYDNQEQVYFEDNLDVPEADRHIRETYTLNLTPNGQIEIPDSRLRFQTPTVTFKNSKDEIRTANVQPSASSIQLSFDNCTFNIRRDNAQFSGLGTGDCEGETLSLSSEALSLPASLPSLSKGLFRRARTFKCWVSPQKEDGTYGFFNDVILHDQGGRAWRSGEGHPRIGLKMRNVVWPTGSNRPSLVLYAYRGDDEDKAVSYTWTGPENDRLAINLRWMQASCTLGDATIQPGINLKTGSGQ